MDGLFPSLWADRFAVSELFEWKDSGMATAGEAQQALLDAIARLAPKANQSRTIRNLAEAYAWVIAPNNPHGGVNDGS